LPVRDGIVEQMDDEEMFIEHVMRDDEREFPVLERADDLRSSAVRIEQPGKEDIGVNDHPHGADLFRAPLTASSTASALIPAHFADLRTLPRASSNFRAPSTVLSETRFGVMIMRLLS